MAIWYERATRAPPDTRRHRRPAAGLVLDGRPGRVPHTRREEARENGHAGENADPLDQAVAPLLARRAGAFIRLPIFIYRTEDRQAM